jgi:hypothetical protein
MTVEYSFVCGLSFVLLYVVCIIIGSFSVALHDLSSLFIQFPYNLAGLVSLCTGFTCNISFLHWF